MYVPRFAKINISLRTFCNVRLEDGVAVFFLLRSNPVRYFNEVLMSSSMACSDEAECCWFLEDIVPPNTISGSVSIEGMGSSLSLSQLESGRCGHLDCCGCPATRLSDWICFMMLLPRYACYHNFTCYPLVKASSSIVLTQDTLCTRANVALPSISCHCSISYSGSR